MLVPVPAVTVLYYKYHPRGRGSPGSGGKEVSDKAGAPSGAGTPPDDAQTLDAEVRTACTSHINLLVLRRPSDTLRRDHQQWLSCRLGARLPLQAVTCWNPGTEVVVIHRQVVRLAVGQEQHCGLAMRNVPGRVQVPDTSFRVLSTSSKSSVRGLVPREVLDRDEYLGAWWLLN